MLAVLLALAVAASAFVKGSIGFGFPTLGTRLLTLLVDVKTALLVLIIPNIVMDGIQTGTSGSNGGGVTSGAGARDSATGHTLHPSVSSGSSASHGSVSK
jgi:hypothetical protein